MLSDKERDLMTKAQALTDELEKIDTSDPTALCNAMRALTDVMNELAAD